MIVGKNFIWGHIPKTAGDVTWTLFMLFPEMIEFAHHPCQYEEKHTFLYDVDTFDKSIILNIRRLPNWMVSLCHQYHAVKKLFPNTSPIRGLEDQQYSNRITGNIHQTTIGDKWLKRMTFKKVKHWIRVEHLEEDFTNVISHFRELQRRDKKIIKDIVTANIWFKPPLAYDRNTEWFTKEEIEEMYEHNPIWKSLEDNLYAFHT